MNRPGSALCPCMEMRHVPGFSGNMLKGAGKALRRPTNVLDILVGSGNALGKGIQADGELQSKAGKLDYRSDEADFRHHS